MNDASTTLITLPPPLDLITWSRAPLSCKRTRARCMPPIASDTVEGMDADSRLHCAASHSLLTADARGTCTRPPHI
eukprot:4525459-Pleurochrysis_carterae.AAC.1